MKIHEKKIEHRFFERVKKGLKKMEIRLNDCNYELGDHIVLRSICTTDPDPNNRKFFYVDEPLIEIVITDIINHDDCPMGLSENYAVLSFDIVYNDKTSIGYILQELKREIEFAENKHGVQINGPHYWTEIILEELGERSKEVGESGLCNVMPENYFTECLHVAVTAIRAVQSQRLIEEKLYEMIVED